MIGEMAILATFQLKDFDGKWKVLDKVAGGGQRQEFSKAILPGVLYATNYDYVPIAPKSL